MTYSEKLKDPRWLRLSRQVLDRDDCTCQSCGDKNRIMHVHHEYYENYRDPWDYPLEALVTLCDQCHRTEESGRYQAFRELNKVIADAGFTKEDIIKLTDAFREVKVKPIFSYLVMSGIYRGVQDSYWDFMDRYGDHKNQHDHVKKIFQMFLEEEEVNG